MLYIYLWRILFLFVITVLISCEPQNIINQNKDYFIDSFKIKLKYAKHLDFSISDSVIAVRVYNPWQSAKDKSFNYLFSINKSKKNDFINIPVKRVICLSTSHIGFITALNKQMNIIGVSGAQFVYDSLTQLLIKQGKIVDVGYEQSLNYELILSLKPDVIIAYGVESKNVGYVTKLEELGLPVVFVAEYLEETPLAKAEWIKFFGILFNMKQNSDSLFSVIDSNYNNIKNIASKYLEKPKVYAGLPWKDTWYIAGGKSNLSCLISDAGADYIWKDNNSKESFPLNLELVFDKVSKADFWINSGSATSLNEINVTDSRLSQLKSFKNKTVYNNIAISNSFGGNDYWESGVVNPHIILKDIVKIFHPKAFPDYKIHYYKKLE
ncbi:MAG: ABC transporter substrate-binding protein [Bacteroidia bacterium]|nr:ABC transporter substrate-binding protein [Bacteroidia bacterium]